MCNPITALTIGSMAYGQLTQRSQANAMERSADAAYAVDKAALDEQGQELGVQHRSEILANSLKFMKRQSTATVAAAEAGVSPLDVVNNEMMQESLAEGELDYNYEIGLRQNSRNIQKAKVTRNTRKAQAAALRPGLLETGIGIGTAYYAGQTSNFNFLKAKEGTG